MAEHFLGPATPAQREQLTAVIESQKEGGKLITPAVLEQTCTEKETIDALIEGLKELVKSKKR